ncbi:MAG: beta-ketoacyl-ACP synthase II [Bdellovibrionales bacterium]|nr:beta-ketoacyl-ACP synthase II [Bdellovibrionales bacterium]
MHGASAGTGAPRRVVVTGIGAVSPLGLTARDSWTAALSGRSGAAPITQQDMAGSPVTFACEVKEFAIEKKIGPYRPKPGSEITEILNRKEARKMGRFIHFAMSAGYEAYGDSGLDAIRERVKAERFGCNIGVGMGGLNEIADVHRELLEKGYRRITPFFIPQVIPNMASGDLSIALDLRGPNLCNLTACSSSAHALGESAEIIRRGDADLMLAGGTEAVIGPLGIGGFAAMRALSQRGDAPEKASRPFDVDRDGFVMGEGAAVMVLEEYEHARKRGARIYGELVGYGLSADAYHMTSPSEGGEGGGRAMKMALERGKLRPEQVGYINAHGTSTPAGDAEEAQAVARLFPEGRKHLHVSSTKSMTGHLLGAAGAIEAMFSLLAVHEGRIPPTINLDRLDPKCAETGLDFTAHRAVEKRVDYALSNSFGFGGTNASLIFGRV